MSKDVGLDALLDLDGSVYFEEGLYWLKIEAKKVRVTPQRPHGLKYSLSFHDRHWLRLFGIDNAHGVKVDRKNSRGRVVERVIEYDHMHRYPGDKGIPYKFYSAEQLMSDFFEQVNKLVEEIKKQNGL